MPDEYPLNAFQSLFEVLLIEHVEHSLFLTQISSETRKAGQI
jgi:hypothetical protein